MLALGDFVTPQMVGGTSGFTFGRIIYSQFGFAFNWPFGAALSVILLARRAGDDRCGRLFDARRGTSYDPPFAASAWRSSAAIAAFVLLVLYGPLFVAVFFSFFQFENNAVQWDSFSFDAYWSLLQDEGIIEAVRNTLFVGAIAVALALIVGTALAFHYNGSRSRFRRSSSSSSSSCPS